MGEDCAGPPLLVHEVQVRRPARGHQVTFAHCSASRSHPCAQRCAEAIFGRRNKQNYIYIYMYISNENIQLLRQYLFIFSLRTRLEITDLLSAVCFNGE